MINELNNLSGVSNWKFFNLEGSTFGRYGLTDRDIEVDLGGLDRLRHSENSETQILAYTSFVRLRPIHARLDAALSKKAAAGVFHVHANETFPMHFSANWRSELRDLLIRIEAWSAALSLEQSVSLFVANRPDRPSVTQINHLVGLAYRGDFTTLEAYVRAFAEGSRLNFVPMITEEVLQAALDSSYDYFASNMNT